MNVMTPTDKKADLTRRTTSDAFSTWHDLSGHWLRSPGAEALEMETMDRRQAAVQRWRGVTEPDQRRAQGF
jgi:nuclear transport factor 2 (NTF2) superfamily protein